MRDVQPRVLLVLTVGVLAVSTAAIMIREADAPALSTAALRLVFASAPALALLPLRGRRELPALGRGGIGWALLSGLCLALHFVVWIGSLELTSVASSVVFVTTSPLFVAGLSAARGEPPARGMWLAIAICLVGGLLIGGADLARGGAALWGDLLALAGAFFVAGYFEIGRGLRASISLTTYTGLVYPAAALFTLVIAVTARQPLSGFNQKTYLLLVLLALVPQLIGHSSLNWALRYLSAPFVAIAVLGEPVVSTLLAVFLLSETPGPLAIVGSLVLLAGVWLALRAERAVAVPLSAPDAAAVATIVTPTGE